MSYKNTIGIIIAAISISFSGCNKQEEWNKPDIVSTAKTSYSDAPVVMGSPKPDPYKYGNMQKAYASISGDKISISPTGIYVKVLVQNQHDWDVLNTDTSIVWFDFPLEFEISQSGCLYRDKSLADSAFWQFGVIPLNYILPNELQVDTIYEVFIPNESPQYVGNEYFFDQLERISYNICGYYKETEEYAQNTSKASLSWYPSATLRVWDDAYSAYVPLQGVRVKAHRGTYTARMVTDANGHCVASNSYKYLVEYSLDWYRDDWRIVSGINNDNTFMTGPFCRSAWVLDINNNYGADLMRATIHRAAIQARFGSLWSIHSPFGSSKRIIRYNHENGSGKVGAASCKSGSYNFHNAHIVIWGFDEYGNLFETDKIFAGTLHELAHWSHYYLVGSSGFSTVQPYVSESWAFCVEWYMMSNLYAFYYGAHGYNDGHQSWSASNPTEYGRYTPVFVDLIDNYNQRNTSSVYCDDRISGYTLSEIEQRISNVKTFAMLNTSLCGSLLHGATVSDVNDLLSIYSGIFY